MSRRRGPCLWCALPAKPGVDQLVPPPILPSPRRHQSARNEAAAAVPEARALSSRQLASCQGVVAPFDMASFDIQAVLS